MMYGVYSVDVGRCMSEKHEFRNHMQGAHKAPFPVPARKFGSSRAYHGVPDSMKFNNIYRMAKIERCVDCLVKEVIEIHLCPMNFNRNNRFMLSKTRQLLLQQVWNTSSEKCLCSATF